MATAAGTSVTRVIIGHIFLTVPLLIFFGDRNLFGHLQRHWNLGRKSPGVVAQPGSNRTSIAPLERL